jgi:hypothetical protein
MYAAQAAAANAAALAAGGITSPSLHPGTHPVLAAVELLRPMDSSASAVGSNGPPNPGQLSAPISASPKPSPFMGPPTPWALFPQQPPPPPPRKAGAGGSAASTPRSSSLDRTWSGSEVLGGDYHRMGSGSLQRASTGGVLATPRGGSSSIGGSSGGAYGSQWREPSHHPQQLQPLQQAPYTLERRRSSSLTGMPSGRLMDGVVPGGAPGGQMHHRQHQPPPPPPHHPHPPLHGSPHIQQQQYHQQPQQQQQQQAQQAAPPSPEPLEEGEMAPSPPHSGQCAVAEGATEGPTGDAVELSLQRQATWPVADSGWSSWNEAGGRGSGPGHAVLGSPGSRRQGDYPGIPNNEAYGGSGRVSGDGGRGSGYKSIRREHSWTGR